MFFTIYLSFRLVDQIETAFGLSDAEFQKKYGIPKPKPKDDNIVFACQVGARSYTACEILQKLGYERLAVYLVKFFMSS